MKMIFSANKRGIPRNNIQPLSNPERQTPSSPTINEPKTTMNINIQILRLGMLARIQNASDCSSCGK